jgi:hypothetical protein
MLVLLQGTFTPLVHAHAGRTQIIAAAKLSWLAGMLRLIAAADFSRVRFVHPK